MAADADTSRRRVSRFLKPPALKPRVVTVALLGLLVIVTALTGWLGLITYQSHRAEQERAMFVQVGRQGALNLTTIDWRSVESDVQRIRGSSTGTFLEDFTARQQAFTDVVQKAKATSSGEIIDAGLESESSDSAQVLVTVRVSNSKEGASEQPMQAWRMRISVTKVGDGAKVSDVEFVR
jgi:Mce-associated membrane protein